MPIFLFLYSSVNKTLECGAHGMSILVMLTVVMETDVATGIAFRIPIVLQFILTAHQSATDPMKTIRNATQDAVTVRALLSLLSLTNTFVYFQNNKSTIRVRAHQ